MHLHHVLLAIPPRSEPEARQFWVDIIGFTEIRKPTELEARGGVWLRHGTAEVHLGIEDLFRPARKAHPAFEVGDLDALAGRLEAADYPVFPDDYPPSPTDTGAANRRRFYTEDPFGNRLEFLAVQGRAS